jgi:protein SCO1/2
MKRVQDLQTLFESFDAGTSAETFAAWVNSIREQKTGGDLLARFLPQQHKIYRNRGTNQVNKLRGYLFASFYHTGAPAAVLSFILEELENSRDAYLTAAAARGLRGFQSPDARFSPYLQKALSNIGHMDDSVNLDVYNPEYPLKNFTTAVSEILVTFQWLGAEAKEAVPFLENIYVGNSIPIDSKIKKCVEETILEIKKAGDPGDCCESSSYFSFSSAEVETSRISKKYEAVKSVIFEDQDGNRIAFVDFFINKPSVVVFFYTRCDNPNKCSLTILRIAQLQKLLAERGIQNRVNLAAITYDSAFDRPSRLKNYAASRNFVTDENHRCLRVLNNDFGLLSEYLNLGVNFSGSIVNHHRIELFILDENGKPIREFTKFQWSVEEISKTLEEVLENRNRTAFTLRGVRKFLSFGSSGFLTFLIVFFPKCPLCWASYFSFLGIVGISPFPYNSQLLGVLLALMIFNLFAMTVRAKRRNSYSPLFLTLTGTIFISIYGFYFNNLILFSIGSVLIFVGSLINSLSPTQNVKINLYLKSLAANILSFCRTFFSPPKDRPTPRN